MTIIKRNGTEVIFDSQKIVDAITKAKAIPHKIKRTKEAECDKMGV